MRKQCNVRTIAAIGAFITVINMAMPLTAQAAAAPSTDLCETISEVTPNLDPFTGTHRAFGNVEGGGSTYEYHLRLCNRTKWPEQEAEQPTLAIADFEIPFFGSTDAELDGSDSDEVNDANVRDVGSPSGWAYQLVELGVPNTEGWTGGISDGEGGFKFSWQIAGETKTFFDNAYGAAELNPFNTVTTAIRWYDTATFAQGEGEDGFNSCVNTETTEGGPGSETNSEGEGEGESTPSGPNVICPLQSLDGFEFIADYPGANAPDESSWVSLQINPNDPPLPSGQLSVAFPNSGAVAEATAVQTPEPSTLGLLGLGLLGTAFVRIRRKRPT